MNFILYNIQKPKTLRHCSSDLSPAFTAKNCWPRSLGSVVVQLYAE